MKVIGLVCSPRPRGNTQTLVEEALEAAGELGVEAELYLAGRKNIAPCDGCEACQKTGKCRTKDDMQELYAKLEEADGIILGSPVYFWSVSAQAKALMDRTFPFKPDYRLSNKVGGAIAVARRRGRTTALSTINGFFTIHQMVIAGAVAALGDERGDVRQDPRALEDARRLGRTMATLIRAGQAVATNR